MKMNPEVKAAWVAALRDPLRFQARERLNDGTGMCCLGVLCDLKDSTAWIEGDPGHFGFRRSSVNEMPPREVCEWAGFEIGPIDSTKYLIPAVVINGANLCLDRHNDDGRSFRELADAIEAQL